MKRMLFIFALAVLYAASVMATGVMPNADFRSTSSMLSASVVSQPSTTDDWVLPSTQTSQSFFASQEDDELDFEDETITEEPEGPMSLGDGLWVLFVCLLCYVVFLKSHNMKRYLTIVLFFLSLSVLADEPDYTELNGKSGASLVQAVQACVRRNYTPTVTYTPGIWQAYCQIDVRPDGYIWDIYSESNQFVPGGDKQGATIRGVGTSYNREHSIPKSWFGGGTKTGTPGADLMHIFPVDGYINSTHNNLPYGEVDITKEHKTFTNSDCLCGQPEPIAISNTLLPSSPVSYEGTSKVFEPLDAYKGDLARGYFATMIMWADLDGEEDNATDKLDYQPFTKEYGAYFFTTDYLSNLYGFTPYGLALMMTWTRNDEVSRKEMNRNNGVEAIQGNRNPFIDIPVLAEYIWGNKAGQTFNLANQDVVLTYSGSYKPIDDNTIHVRWMVNGEEITGDEENANHEYTLGEALRLPTDMPTGCDSDGDGTQEKRFIGWTAERDYYSLTSVPADLFTSAGSRVVNASITYYAVFSTLAD